MLHQTGLRIVLTHNVALVGAQWWHLKAGRLRPAPTNLRGQHRRSGRAGDKKRTTADNGPMTATVVVAQEPTARQAIVTLLIGQALVLGGLTMKLHPAAAVGRGGTEQGRAAVLVRCAVRWCATASGALRLRVGIAGTNANEAGATVAINQ